ncbi:cupin domain-containing protein [Microbacterium sp. P01]|uniref:cupin domain-containing protein n=1 Tax=Microbacterium sp. P01 TaxID=3366261 RepID=UPI00366B2473
MDTIARDQHPIEFGNRGLVPADRIRISGSRTLKFEGVAYGSGVSFFLVTNDPGMGPGLHRHPYTETWTVLEGEATIAIGAEQYIARTGDTAVVQAQVWHGFRNTGDSVLRIVCMHDSPVILQEDHDDAEGANG